MNDRKQPQTTIVSKMKFQNFIFEIKNKKSECSKNYEIKPKMKGIKRDK